MRIQVSALTEPQLIWAIAKAEGYIDDCNSWLYLASVEEANDSEAWRPLSWSVAGPIIEREAHNLFKHNGGTDWCCACNVPRDGYTAIITADGPTPLIAAMRCYITSKLGENVEVPDELLKASNEN